MSRRHKWKKKRKIINSYEVIHQYNIFFIFASCSKSQAESLGLLAVVKRLEMSNSMYNET